MTNKELECLEILTVKLDNYIKADNIWKKNIELQLKPLTDERFDRIVVSRYSKLGFKVAAGLIAFFISVLILFNLTIALFKK